MLSYPESCMGEVCPSGRITSRGPQSLSVPHLHGEFIPITPSSHCQVSPLCNRCCGVFLFFLTTHRQSEWRYFKVMQISYFFSKFPLDLASADSCLIQCLSQWFQNEFPSPTVCQVQQTALSFLHWQELPSLSLIHPFIIGVDSDISFFPRWFIIHYCTHLFQCSHYPRFDQQGPL